MRMSEHNRYLMKKHILSDLYGVQLSKIVEEKEVFLRKNLVLEYAPYTEYIAKLPEHLLNRAYRYVVQVTYKKNDPVDHYSQTWSITLANDEVGPLQDRNYAIHPSLYAEVVAIIEEEQEVTREKDEMASFIKNTFNTTTGSKQIRQMWPESLHKYLPAEPIVVKRQKNSKGKFILPTIAAPAQLQTRLVNNLLEK